MMRKEETGVALTAWSASRELLEFKLREGRSKRIGETFINNSGDAYTVLGQLDLKIDGRAGYNHFLIEFEDGTRIVATENPVRNGKVKNPNKPSVYGQGYLGLGNHSVKTNKKEYDLWIAMLGRCYDPKFHLRCPTYSKCEVSPRWHNFQSFCEDLPNIHDYEKWVEGQNNPRNDYELDKDIKVKGNKIYSKDTCMFVTHLENNKSCNKDIAQCIQNHLTGLTYVATTIETGEEEEFWNISKFARDHNLNQGNIGMCLQGIRHTHKGMSFRIKP